MKENLDQIDRSLLRALQRDARLSQRELAETVGLSQNACWRRLKTLYEGGLIEGHTIRLDPARLGLNLTVFVMIRTRHHSKDWLATFRKEVSAIPNVIDFYRIAGDYDYMLKVVAEDMNAFDRVYQRLIEKVDLDTVTSYMTMEAIADARDLPI
ncbi:MAG: Lrp/AsnC family transcriptional regulator [Roseibium album]|uniref:HTH asnC-type domain-containing protein n=2 Tax=cellular organisms TaxID=131567 RepID=A0AA36JF76_9DINO|nr:Lrp/AsnC family transcriptional regulator [Roseibium album]MBG6146945.1 Lrp/AsnC family transcriptional regulator [Labrenzia sp. EL_142]MBG6155406.1 Lrp/AsnC family transcriptional regulator [Labrenzia sp. EL_162]MBG6160862.1 Lrp/AsnC family transcriptional regulator [Labrenzia sp. EL_195]MBG6176155.1 Lrp/AsnC family transcriptional regulator [Labrenzia sp. EL_132]MBG6193941.1 Lrp/AsnC family transcriptional regulator [Labrenzia sp. EL_159]MBG6201084.1 Lrp/AsnC family transcriptional regul